jgi:hypothetical protein
MLIVHAIGFRSTPIGIGDTRGKFRAQASTMSAPVSSSLDAGGQLAGAGYDSELANLLAVIADDVQRLAAGMCQAITAEYAGKIAHARQSLPRDQVAGVIAALKAQRQAALAVAHQSAAVELAGRREAAIRAHRKPLRVVGKPLDGLTRK